jgi:hypothetical protein
VRRLRRDRQSASRCAGRFGSGHRSDSRTYHLRIGVRDGCRLALPRGCAQMSDRDADSFSYRSLYNHLCYHEPREWNLRGARKEGANTIRLAIERLVINRGEKSCLSLKTIS